MLSGSGTTALLATSAIIVVLNPIYFFLQGYLWLPEGGKALGNLEDAYELTKKLNNCYLTPFSLEDHEFFVEHNRSLLG